MTFPARPLPGLSRRRFLRGAGVALGLPWLESLAPAAEAGGPPIRVAARVMGNGVNPHHWGAKTGPEGIEFAKTLSPLVPHAAKVNVFHGLWNPTATNENGHYSKMNVLSGLKVKRTTTDVEVGISVDQLMARAVGRTTPLPSVVLGTEPPGYSTDAGYTQIYSAYVSWSSPTTPAPKEIVPRQAFDQLFDDGSRRRADASVLDLVAAEAASLRGRLGGRDRAKLAEYLTSVRELERRIERSAEESRRETGGHGWRPTVTEPSLERPGPGIPAEPREHLELMCDILLLAFQMDRTRVATLMLNNDLSNMNFGFLGGIHGGQHELSHHANNAGRLEQYQRVNEYHMALLARLLARMDATFEGERTLLDNSMVLFCSSLMDGNAHDSKELPIVLAGGGGGTIRGGRVHDLRGQEDRRLCRLHLAMMQRIGLAVDRFGDADTPLDLA
ncbi:MAG: DUF1552 domain-containing protein [Planctomycetia bacterium]